MLKFCMERVSDFYFLFVFLPNFSWVTGRQERGSRQAVWLTLRKDKGRSGNRRKEDWQARRRPGVDQRKGRKREREREGPKRKGAVSLKEREEPQGDRQWAECSGFRGRHPCLALGCFLTWPAWAACFIPSSQRVSFKEAHYSSPKRFTRSNLDQRKMCCCNTWQLMAAVMMVMVMKWWWWWW